MIDIFTDDTMWLIDEGMEASCTPGLLFAGRLMAVGDFMMTCGVSVPLTAKLLEAAIGNMPRVGASSREVLLNDPRFAILIYRSAIATGTMESMQLVDSDELAFEAEAVD